MSITNNNIITGPEYITITPSGGTFTTGIITSSTDRYMIFTGGTSSFTNPGVGITCDILMIGGGGAGGWRGGGGGAGACIIAIGHTLPAGNCIVSVGSGGNTTTFANYNEANTNGGDSSISVGGTTKYLARGSGRGSVNGDQSTSGGCGGGQQNMANKPNGGVAESTNVVNGITGIGPTNSQLTYAILGNRGGNHNIPTIGNNGYDSAGGGGIGSIPRDQVTGDISGGSGGAGLNAVTINTQTYNFKTYFANNTTFGNNNDGYIDGGGGGGNFEGNGGVGGNAGIGGGGKGCDSYDINTPPSIRYAGSTYNGRNPINRIN